jgi:hypothetical protein
MLIGARILAFLIGHWLEIALGLILGGLCIGFAHHERAVQKAKDADEIAALTDQLKVDRDVFRAIKASINKNKAAAEAQAKAGQAALAESTRKAKADERAWRGELAKAHKAVANVTCADQALPDGIDL